jgi:hypothetical protein
VSVAAFTGTPLVVPTSGRGAVSVAVFPGAGCACLVEFQITSGGGWFPWEPGQVTVATGRSILSRIRGVRFTRISGTNSCSAEVA